MGYNLLTYKPGDLCGECGKKDDLADDGASDRVQAVKRHAGKSRAVFAWSALRLSRRVPNWMMMREEDVSGDLGLEESGLETD